MRMRAPRNKAPDRRFTNEAPSEKRGVKDILERHDPSVALPKQIREGIAKMRKLGPEQWLYEVEFSRLSGVGTNQIGRFRQAFEGHIVAVPGRDGRPKLAWFADTKVAKRVRDQLRKSIVNYDDGN